MSTPSDPFYHLDVSQTAKLRIKVHTDVMDQAISFNQWLLNNGIPSQPKRLIHPGPWRISYGMLKRLANALGYSRVDALFRDLSTK